VIASLRPYAIPIQYLQNLKYLNAKIAPSLFHFPKDMLPVKTEVNRLNNQVLVQYYEAEWHRVTE
jgi:spermidine synthase